MGNPYDPMDKGTAGLPPRTIYDSPVSAAAIYKDHMFAGDPTGGLSNIPKTDRYVGVPAYVAYHLRGLEELIESLTRRVAALEERAGGRL